jgi:hypothetical protein
MARRFSDLEKQVKAILANGGNPLTSSDEAVRKFWEWYTNPSSAAHRLQAGSKRATDRKLDERAIITFNEVLPTGGFAKVLISKRTAAAATGGILTALGYQTLTTEQKAVKVGKFKPAQVYWRTGEATTSADRVSRITNRPYKSYYAAGDQGYTASFGKTGTDSYTDRVKAIKTALGNTISLVTFTAEKYSG